MDIGLGKACDSGICEVVWFESYVSCTWNGLHRCFMRAAIDCLCLIMPITVSCLLMRTLPSVSGMRGPVVRVCTAVRDVCYCANSLVGFECRKSDTWTEREYMSCVGRARSGTVLGLNKGLHKRGRCILLGVTRMLTGY